MPAWNDYKKHAKERGSLALELYAVETTPVEGADLGAVIASHLDYQKGQEAAGALVLAGPLSDDSGEEMQGSGLIIYRAASMEDARAIADGDPMHSTGARTYRLRKWLVNEGSLNLSVGLASGRVTLS